ncbi:MAG: hypothetical protein D6679_05260 [Candidatus Hydrogenedentota bacterium]|nr:MAG: hypothetical protein D6679_05260 [Candidatus Hydrogenedentota bacterium]
MSSRGDDKYLAEAISGKKVRVLFADWRVHVPFADGRDRTPFSRFAGNAGFMKRLAQSGDFLGFSKIFSTRLAERRLI